MAKKSNKKWVVGGSIIIAAVIAMTFLNLGDNLVYFYTPVEAVAKAAELEGQNIKVGGMVKEDTVQWEAEQLSLKFVMTDMQGNEINVSHKGTPPDMFKQGQGVVVEGRLANNGKDMISRNLMVKHSEEYKKPDATHSMDKELLQKSLFKGQTPPSGSEANPAGSGTKGS
jgi:cytochrome c-type biogenesis protein CcmE